MAVLSPLGVDQTTGQSRTLKSGDTLDGSIVGFDFLNIGSTSAAVAAGDLAASDGTSTDGNSNLISLFYDASTSLSVGALSAITSFGISSVNPGGFVFGAESGASDMRALLWSPTGYHLSMLKQPVFAGGPGFYVNDENLNPTFAGHVARDTSVRQIIFRGMRARGSLQSPTFCQTDNIIVSLNGAALNTASPAGNSSDYSDIGRVQVVASENHTAAALGGRIEFSTITNTTTTLVEKMRLSNGGGLTVGDVASLGSSDFGDIVAGDGTRTLSWDASAGVQTISGFSTVNSAPLVITGSANGGIWGLAENTDASGAVAYAAWRVENDNNETGQIRIFGGTHPFVGDTQVIANNGNLRLSSGTGSNTILEVANTSYWFLNGDTTGSNTVGHFCAQADNSYDIGSRDGGTSSLRPRNIYVGTEVIVDGAALPRVLARVASIDLTTTGDTLLFTVPSGQSANIVSVVVRPTAVTAPNADAEVSIGTNASTYDDIISSQPLTGLDVTTESYTLAVGGISHIAAAAEEIRFQVDTADTGTAITVTVDLIGYLF